MIKKTFATITQITDLSPTAKEITLQPEEQINFVAGSFVNVFMDIGGEKIRRAYSISSSDQIQNTFTLSIRLSPNGKMTPLFWNTDLLNTKVEIMGPLGLNTANKMDHSKIYLFGFGIGAGVVKSIAEHFTKKESVEHITIVTGSRTEDEIIYQDFFDALSKNSLKVTVDYAVSSPKENTPHKKGYIQDHLSMYDFNNSDVYVCGQEVACNALVQKVKDSEPIGCEFFIEGFH